MDMNHGQNATRQTGGQAIVDALLANGVDTLFGLPGAQMYGLFDALYLRRDRITTISARHEQACGYMAFGYARSTGRPGVFSVVPGPGMLNAAAAMATAQGCAAPVLCVTGQVPSAFIGRGRGHLHELPDQLATLRSFVKWAARIERAADAPAVVNEAFRQMLSGRPGVVAIEMPWDIISGHGRVIPEEAAEIPGAPPPDAEAIGQAVAQIVRARRPMIVLGSGAQHAPAEVTALAEAIGAPVTSFRGGRGVVAEDHPLGLSAYAASRLWPQTDLLIGIGSRVELPYMRWGSMTEVRDGRSAVQPLVLIDIDPAAVRHLAPTVGIVADAAVAVRALLDGLRAAGHVPGDTLPAIAQAREEAAASIQTVQPHATYLAMIRAALPREGILVEELCQTGFASYFAYPVFTPRSYISPGFQGTLGCGFQTALGVKIAHPETPVVSIAGDGGFMFGVQELATMAQHRIALVAVVFNNRAFGNVLKDQQRLYEGHLIGCELHNPDFIQLAQSFGIAAARVSGTTEFPAVLRAAIDSNAPALIEVTLDSGGEVSPWPFIHPF